MVPLIQKEYDAWDQSDPEYGDGNLGFGGICQDFAEIIADVINTNSPFEANTVAATMGEQHVYTVVKTPDGVYEVDIPYNLYETGGGYTWQKIEDVVFNPSFFSVYRLDANPDNFHMYVEDY